MRGTPDCPDCGATTEKWGDCWRCPWSAARPYARPHSAGHVFGCNRPFVRGAEITAPLTGQRQR